MKNLKITVEINVEIDGDEGIEGKYAQVFNALDDCGYENDFGFKVLSKEVKNHIGYPEYIMKYLRQREGLDESDTSLDQELQDLPKNSAFYDVLGWKGLLGGWDDQIKAWVKDIYGIDLNQIKD